MKYFLIVALLFIGACSTNTDHPVIVSTTTNTVIYSCKGSGPIKTGEPGFNPRLDRDGDGIACEP